MAKVPPLQAGRIATCVHFSTFAAKALRETRPLPSLKNHMAIGFKRKRSGTD